MTEPIATPTAAGPSARGKQATGAGVFAYWPNRITAIRFVGALVLFVVLALIEPRDRAHAAGGEPVAAWMWNAALWLFVAVAATDWLDGWLARRTGHVTAFGRIADPFVDKILVLGCFVFLAVLPHGARFVPAWVVVAILARELLVTGIRGYVESLGMSFGADRWGKLKLVVQCIAIGVVLGLPALPWPGGLETVMVWVAHVAVWFTLVSTVGSGASYADKCRRMLAARGDGS